MRLGRVDPFLALSLTAYAIGIESMCADLDCTRFVGNIGLSLYAWVGHSRAVRLTIGFRHLSSAFSSSLRGVRPEMDLYHCSLWLLVTASNDDSVRTQMIPTDEKGQERTHHPHQPLPHRRLRFSRRNSGRRNDQ